MVKVVSKTTVEVPIEKLIGLRKDQENYYDLLRVFAEKLTSIADPEVFKSMSSRVKEAEKKPTVEEILKDYGC